MGAANKGSGGAVGLGGDAAGVDDDHISSGGAFFGKAGGTERVVDGFAIGAGGAATEMFDVEEQGHAPLRLFQG